MQVDPIKPTLKAPGSKRLKLECDILPSCFAFKINLRRYSMAKHGYLSEKQAGSFASAPLPSSLAIRPPSELERSMVGLCKMNPVLKAPAPAIST